MSKIVLVCPIPAYLSSGDYIIGRMTLRAFHVAKNFGSIFRNFPFPMERLFSMKGSSLVFSSKLVMSLADQRNIFDGKIRQ